MDALSTESTWGADGTMEMMETTSAMSNISHVGFELERRPEAIVVPILFGLVFVVGVIGNGTLIYTVAFNKPMRNVPNVLIVSLSAGDMLLLLFSVPFSATTYTLTDWPYGVAVCKINYFMQTLSLGVTVFTLTALSADRYMAIFDPLSKHTDKMMAKTMGTAVSIWILSALLAIPDAVLVDVLQSDGGLHYCARFPPKFIPIYPEVRTVVVFLVYFTIPLIIISVVYLAMARLLIKSGDAMPCEGKSYFNQQRQITARKKVAKIVLSFVVIFVVCWLPRHIYLLWFWLDKQAEYTRFWHGFQIVGYCLVFVNSCINPFALYFLSGQFRKHYNRYLFCCLPISRYRNLDPSTTMHFFQSTRRGSSTNTTMVQSQSMC